MSPAFVALVSPRIPERPFANFDAAQVELSHLRDADMPRSDVAALAVFSETVDDGVLGRFPELRIVANYGVGYDNVDVAACTKRGVVVTNTPDVVDGATADLALALMLASRRRLIEGDSLVRRGGWKDATDADPLRGRDLHGSTLGIVGCGRIGQSVARRAAGFELTLLYTQRTKLDPDLERDLNLSYRSLADLLRESDVVSIHCPLTPATTKLIGADELALMRDGSCLINTARGAIVDEPALVAELESGRLNAGLDVFAHEPKVPDVLRELPNVVLSPHTGTGTVETREAMAELVARNISGFLKDGEPLTPVSV